MFSSDSKWLVVGNIMGEICVWDLYMGEFVLNWMILDFISWGIIKSYCYFGGVFVFEFMLDDELFILVGMGLMCDLMVGNGR